jgi:hypothetical protein
MKALIAEMPIRGHLNQKKQLYEKAKISTPQTNLG